MSATVIVTGAAGFIGSHLSRALLARGDRVVGVDNFDPFYDEALKRANVSDLDGKGFELVEADICDADAMRALFERVGPGQVVHLAALAGVRPSLEAPRRYVHVNVCGTASILKAARHVGCARFACASSSSVYGNSPNVPFVETDPAMHPISPYAASKRATELLCETYTHLHGLSIALLRFFTVFGPGQRPDLAINRFLRLVNASEEIPLFGDGTTSRDYTCIDDIVDGVLRSLGRLDETEGPWCRAYNLGGSSPVTLADMIDAIGATVGRAPRTRRMPMQTGDVVRTYADLTRSKAELGYEPRIPFEEGLRRQWEWQGKGSGGRC
jgi:UDP-glucuronate 4-epimerase